MKYIRTESGVYDRDKCILNGWNFVFDTKIKEAGTIEELCDSFVIRENKKNKISLFSISNGFETAKEWAVDREYKNYEILGAIWTDKGLIYIAKMNEEGKLELI